MRLQGAHMNQVSNIRIDKAVDLRVNLSYKLKTYLTRVMFGTPESEFRSSEVPVMF